MWFINEKGKIAETVLLILLSAVILRDGLKKLRN